MHYRNPLANQVKMLERQLKNRDKIIREQDVELARLRRLDNHSPKAEAAADAVSAVVFLGTLALVVIILWKAFS